MQDREISMILKWILSFSQKLSLKLPKQTTYTLVRSSCFVLFCFVLAKNTDSINREVATESSRYNHHVSVWLFPLHWWNVTKITFYVPLPPSLATHSSMLAWRIPWAEEPDRLKCMGSRRAGFDWVNNAHTSLISIFCHIFGGNITSDLWTSCRDYTVVATTVNLLPRFQNGYILPHLLVYLFCTVPHLPRCSLFSSCRQ